MENISTNEWMSQRHTLCSPLWCYILLLDNVSGSVHYSALAGLEVPVWLLGFTTIASTTWSVVLSLSWVLCAETLSAPSSVHSYSSILAFEVVVWLVFCNFRAWQGKHTLRVLPTWKLFHVEGAWVEFPNCADRGKNTRILFEIP